MKKIILLLVFITTNIIFAQGKVKFEADIANRNGDIIYIKDNMGKPIKEIKINEKGIFADSIEINDGSYLLFDGVEYAQLYLKNGYDLKLKMDAKQFDESIKFSGIGAPENNFLAESAILDQKIDFGSFLNADETTFNKLVSDKKDADFKRIEKSGLDTVFIDLQKKSVENNLMGLQQYYNQIKANKKLNNTKAPNFDYENHAGGKTSLESLKGKYVYIDVWATWCGPCRQEIPFLQKVEEKFHDKNIAFVSISVDVEKDHDKWKKFVSEKNLGGIQLFADNNWNSDFIKAFGINSIPRFILIDPTGNVIDADAKRPSDTQLSAQFESLLK
jgi:thiol-disulfide isomerase/thioredoxin